MYELIFVRPWPGWIAGPLIGLYAVAFFVFQRRNLGASSSFPATLEALKGKDEHDLGLSSDPLLLPAATSYSLRIRVVTSHRQAETSPSPETWAPFCATGKITPTAK
jgi:hypothetical protein